MTDVAPSRPWYFQWPLWGLRCPDGDVAVWGGVFYQPTWQDWENDEKTDVVREYAGRWLEEERLGLEPVEKPPICYRRAAEPQDDGWKAAFADHWTVAHVVFDALRLMTAGDFAHPDQTGDYIDLAPGQRLRMLRPWRAAFYDRQFANPYVLRATDAPELERLAELIARHTASADSLNGELAIELFRLGHAVGVEADERAMLLFGALEALLGPLRGRFATIDRAELAARAAGRPELHDWLARDAVQWRNRVTHGNIGTTGEAADSSSSVEDLESLRDVTRAVIVSYLERADQLPPDEANLVLAFLTGLAETT